MQLTWLWRGLRTGVVTTRYPSGAEAMAPGWRGLIRIDPDRCRDVANPPACVRSCLPGALALVPPSAARASARIRLDAGACIACGLCVLACPEGALEMGESFELAVRSRASLETTCPAGSEEPA